MTSQGKTGVKPPRQERSRRTQDALLNAGEELLADRLFSQLSVQEITERAGSSPGSFYARFPGKQAFLIAIRDRVRRRLIKEFEKTLEETQGPMSVDEVSEFAIETILRSHSANRGLIRSLVTESANNEEIANGAGAHVSAVAKTLAPHVIAPGYSIEEIAEELRIGQLTISAILDQGLFFDGNLAVAAEEGIGAKGDIERDSDFFRLVRIFRASMNL